MLISLHIPVSPMIKKYLVVNFGEEYRLSNTDWLGILISSSLRQKSHYRYEHKALDTTLTERYKVLIHGSYSEKHGYFLTKTQKMKVYKAIDNIFRQSIFEQAVMNKICYGIDYKITINNILDLYDMDRDQINYESLLRDFYRKKDKILTQFDKKNF